MNNKELYKAIQDFLDIGKSYGFIAKKILPGIPLSTSKSAIYRFYNEHKEITSNELRILLGMDKLMVITESYLRKYPKRQTRRTRDRIAISKRDPRSAARSIRNNVHYGVDELVKELRGEDR